MVSVLLIDDIRRPMSYWHWYLIFSTTWNFILISNDNKILKISLLHLYGRGDRARERKGRMERKKNRTNWHWI